MDNEILKQIKKKMIDKEMNQSELSYKTGITNDSISRLLNGKTNPTLKSLNKILEILDLKIKIVEKNENLHN